MQFNKFIEEAKTSVFNIFDNEINNDDLDFDQTARSNLKRGVSLAAERGLFRANCALREASNSRRARESHQKMKQAPEATLMEAAASTHPTPKCDDHLQKYFDTLDAKAINPNEFIEFEGRKLRAINLRTIRQNRRGYRS
jgi:ribosomal protein S20